MTHAATPLPFKSRPQQLWEDYLAARAKAEETRRFDDARDAARIWNEFLREFTPVKP